MISGISFDFPPLYFIIGFMERILFRFCLQTSEPQSSYASIAGPPSGRNTNHTYNAQKYELLDGLFENIS